MDKVNSQKEGFVDNVLGLVMKVVLQLMKNVLTPSAKRVLIPLRFTEAESAT